ncbi:MAG: energy-coupling factor ABC transporter ATP-binding protein [Bacillota bacterium]
MVNDKFVFELSGVSFNYPYDEPVLRNISLGITEGEKVCILGANGCGKSTLLKLLAGLVYPKSGSFKAFGQEVSEKSFLNSSFLKTYHKRIGFIFQESDVQLFCSTVREEIAFGPMQLDLPRDDVIKRVEDIMNLLDICHLRNKVPFKLSGGEKKKVAIASVLVLNPQVLILDEPTNGLDPKTQRWMAELLTTLNNNGKTLIISTHNLDLVLELSDRAVVLGEDHSIAIDDSTGTVLKSKEVLRQVNLI